MRSLRFSSKMFWVRRGAKPDMKALIACAEEMAQRLGVKAPSKQKLRGKINEVLVKRNYFQCFEMNIISFEELRNVFLAHVQTFICQEAGVEQLHKPVSGMTGRVEKALLK
jgi:hypothetical protein